MKKTSYYNWMIVGIILVALLTIFDLVVPCFFKNDNEISDTESNVSVEIETPSDFLNQEENFAYRADNRISQRVTKDGKYLLKRYANFITVNNLNLDEENYIIIDGDNFVITDNNEIWFVNKDRKICRFSCDEHDSQTSEPNIFVSDAYGDVRKNIKVNEYSFDFYEPEKDSLAVATVNGTLLFEKGNILLKRLGKQFDILSFPAPVKEVYLIDDWYGGAYSRSHVVYAAILDNNSLVTITVDDRGMQWKLLFDGRNHESVSFLKKTEKNQIDEIVLRDGYVFFYVGQVLHLSNGEQDILVDDLPWERIWQFGDSDGPGKCLDPYAAFWAKSKVSGKDFDLETEMSKTGINY